MNDLKSFELTWIKRTNIPKDLEKIDFLLNERFLWTNFSKNDGFLLNKRFHYTNDFTERSFRKKSERLWTIHFWERKKSTIEKKMNEMGCSRKMNDRNKKKSNVTISTAHFWCNTSSIKKPWADVFERCEII